MNSFHSIDLLATNDLTHSVQWAVAKAALVTLSASCGAAAVSAAGPTDGSIPSEVYTHPQQLVSIDGVRRLNLFCMGSGEPVVLFEAGAGDDATTWRLVQGQISAMTQACAYDRAGYGFSDESGRASDARNNVDDLHRLLQAAPIHTPIVFVGHSAGGIYGALLQAAYPNDIAGAVLVDPSFLNQWKSVSDVLSPEARSEYLKPFLQWSDDTHACLELARSGALATPSTKQAKNCVDPENYGPDPGDQLLRSELARRYAQTKVLSAMASEIDSVLPGKNWKSVDDDQLESAPLAFGDKPLIVLTRDRWHSARSSMTPTQEARRLAVWVAGHGALSNTSRHGSHVVVANSGHNVQIDQPNAVIDAVRRVVEEVRQIGRPKAASDARQAQ
jgi:pimeloyl-ACP methyl ester carboxylesterase